MTVHLRIAATSSLLLIALTACDSPEPAAAPASAAPTAIAPTAAAPTSSTPSATATPTTSPTPTFDPYQPLKMGTSVSAADGIVTAAVYGYKQPVARTAPRPDEQPGFVWGAADVKVCATKDAPAPGVSVSNGPWALVYDDDTQIVASSIGYQQFPEPGYPFGEKDLAVGRCVRGWITFAVPGKKRPKFVEYAPEGQPVSLRWTVR